MEMISVKLANSRIKKPLKGCESFCKAELEDKISFAGDEATNDGGLCGFDQLAIDPYFQEKFLNMFGDVIVWINSDYHVAKLSPAGRG